MKSFLTILFAGLVSALVMPGAARADGHGHDRWERHGGWGHHDDWGRHDDWGHGRHHHGHHHHGHRPDYVVIHERPIYYPPPPRVIHHYHEPRVVYERPYPSYGYGGYSGPLPIIAGGVLGGVVGEQVGRGDHGAIIGGSVLGAVLGNEMAR